MLTLHAIRRTDVQEQFDIDNIVPPIVSTSGPYLDQANRSNKCTKLQVTVPDELLRSKCSLFFKKEKLTSTENTILQFHAKISIKCNSDRSMGHFEISRSILFVAPGFMYQKHLTEFVSGFGR